MSDALDVPYTTSCGHTWTMRHTACPECFAALRQRVEELERAVALLDQAATDYRKGRDAAEAKLAARGE